VAVRAFRDEPSLAAGRVSGHHQILVIHAPRARSRLNAALISAGMGRRLGEVPLLLSGAAAMRAVPSRGRTKLAIWPHAASESRSRSVIGAGLLLARKYPPIYTFRPVAGAVEATAERLDL
jgi:hypothetical protein